MWLGKIGDHGFLASPTDAGLFMAAVVLPMDRRDELRRDREAAYAAALAHWPELEASLGGRTTGRAGPDDVALARLLPRVGRARAGCWSATPATSRTRPRARGSPTPCDRPSSWRPRSSRALGGAAPADRALHDWWSWRDRDAWEMYWFAHDMGAAGPTPLVVQEIQRRIAADRELTEGLIRVLNHDLAPSQAFTPALALAAASKALLVGRGRRRVVLREVRTILANQLRRRARGRRMRPDGAGSSSRS